MWELAYKKSWMPKNWWFWTVMLEKSLESRLDCKEIKPVSPKGNHSWIFIGRMMLKLKLQYFGHLIRRTDSLGKTLMLGKIEGRRRRGQQRMRWWMASPTWWTWVWASSKSWWWTGKPGMLQSTGSQRVGHDWATELNWPKRVTRGQHAVVFRETHIRIAVRCLFFQQKCEFAFNRGQNISS